ncbi:DUF4160 domain-containing protein [Spirosoma soli]|uniref:DUF4160 domain-containing protein n=1 Tax=Spirosoma soli TaxID=1770529 RepID=A0ABW5MDV7_9BACT
MDEGEVLELLENLRNKLAQMELLTRPSRGGDYIELLLLKKENLKFRIDADFNHSRPHFHVDYGREFHALSVCINTGEVLAGYIPNKYLKTVTFWVEENKETLLKIWDSLRLNQNATPFVAQLKAV